MSQEAVREAIARLAEGRDLDEAGAMAAMEAILTGDAMPAQIGAIAAGAPEHAPAAESTAHAGEGGAVALGLPIAPLARPLGALDHLLGEMALDELCLFAFGLEEQLAVGQVGYAGLH